MSVRVAVNSVLRVAGRIGGRVLSPRFGLFCAVGLSGMAVHLVVLQGGYWLLGMSFIAAQAAATWAAMTSNYFLNNAVTFRDRMLRGAARWRGLLAFYASCSVGAVIAVAVGEFLYSRDVPVWASGLGGAVIAAIWNFAISEGVTWRGSGSARP